MIASARQLFGTYTFQIFWDDGFQALASLDDDRDGVLRGEELKGIALWFDENGNAVSDPGEVQPLEVHGVRALQTRPQGREAGMLHHAVGIERETGAPWPVWDWEVESR